MILSTNHINFEKNRQSDTPRLGDYISKLGKTFSFGVL